jgi:hypothetical protein
MDKEATMDAYSIALFLHIVGALGFFAALGLEWTSLRQIGSAATTDWVLGWMRISKSTLRLGIASMLTLLASGFYMMATVWGGAGWITVTLGALVPGIVLSVAVTGPRMAAIGRALAAGRGPVSRALHGLANDPTLRMSVQIRVAIALGIVFLKIVKPGLAGSLLVIGAAVILGLASALPLPRRERAREAPGD